MSLLVCLSGWLRILNPSTLRFNQFLVNGKLFLPLLLPAGSRVCSPQIVVGVGITRFELDRSLERFQSV